MRFWKGLALRKLGKEERAREEFEALVGFALSKSETEGRYAYFDVQPTPLPFENDLARRNAVASSYLRGLGLLGLRKPDEAEREFRTAISLDANHFESHFMLEQGRDL
jgi:tetratricopeptide (TPR) repeat protein